jgi:hypothetical protein
MVKNPEEELLQKGKYMARFKLGWTDAIPTRYLAVEPCCMPNHALKAVVQCPSCFSFCLF